MTIHGFKGCSDCPASASIGLGAAFEVLGIQNVTTFDAAATNMALRGAHFKHEATPIWLVQHATCAHQNDKSRELISDMQEINMPAFTI